MKVLIVKKPFKMSNILIKSFDEEYHNYLHNCKKKMWATLEGFSLEYDSCIDDLKQCVWVYPENDKTYNYIKEHFKVIEEI